MKIFQLARDEDETGVSGTGIVAEGVEFWDGTVVLKWLGELSSTAVYPDMATCTAIHGHNGKTRFIYVTHALDDSPRLLDHISTVTDADMREAAALSEPWQRDL